jgi:TetR/AcrR family transcriptional regulator, cholesterol catabolism regulator
LTGRRPHLNQGEPREGTLNEKRWSEILRDAAEVFSEKGYEATTIEDIATRVGLLKGSLYYYMENKADLLFQITTRALRQHLEALQEDRGIAQGNAALRLSHFVDRFMTEIECGEFASLGAVDFDLRFLGPERLAVINDGRRDIYLLLKRILASGIAEGTFDSKTDASFAANSILYLINTTPKWHRGGGTRSIREVAEWYKGFILAGLGVSPEESCEADSMPHSLDQQ